MSINTLPVPEHNYEKFCEECEVLIRQGDINSVYQKIKALHISQIPRKYRFILGRICRRIGAVTDGLKILKKNIFNQMPGEAGATEQELCEYAVLLSRIGSIDEAISILKNLNTISDVHLYLGFCLISKWNYAEAAIELDKFLNLTQDKYTKMVAEVNLASALISMRKHDEALFLLDRLIHKDLVNGNKRLLGNCLELRAQIHFEKSSISKAEEDLTAAYEIFKQSNSYDEILVQKWNAIIQAHKSHSIQPLLDFKQIVIQKAHWESVREIDLQSLKIHFDQSLFDYLYYGTPYQSFRLRMCEEIQASPAANFYYGDPQGIKFSIMTGMYGPMGSENKISSKLLDLLSSLIQDFYSPISMGAIFSKVYVGEQFDIESSPLKVRQILSRLRKWLDEQEINAPIILDNSRYKINIIKGIGFTLQDNELSMDSGDRNYNRAFERLRTHFNNQKYFTVQDVERQLNLSRSDFHRIMRFALKENKVIKKGSGKSTRYQIVSLPTQTIIKKAG